MKPTTQILDTVEALYDTLLQVENKALVEGKTTAEAIDLSKAALLDEVRKLDYNSYELFSQRCLNAEIEQRSKELSRLNLKLFPKSLKTNENRCALSFTDVYDRTLVAYDRLGVLLDDLDAFVSISDGIRQRQEKVRSIAEDFRLDALNANIAAEPLGEAGVTIGTIAHFLQEYARALSGSVKTLDQNISVTSASVAGVSSRLATARLQFEMLLSFLAEIAQNSLEQEQIESLFAMAENLRQALSVTLNQVLDSIIDVQGKLPSLRDNKEQIRKVVINLHVAQIAGLTESARIDNAEGLHSMFGGLRQQIEFTQNELVHIENTVVELTCLTNATQPKVKNVIECLAEQSA